MTPVDKVPEDAEETSSGNSIPISDVQLTELLEEVLGSTKGIRDEMVIENRKRDTRIRTNRYAVVLAGLAALIGCIVGIQGQKAAHKATHAVQISEQERTERTLASCLQANVAADTAIKAADKHDIVLSNNLAPAPRTAKTQQRVDVFLKQEHQSAVEGNPLRDCSPAGIEKFLQVTTTTVP